MTEKYFSLSAIKEDFDWLESQGSGDITCREVIERLENRIIKESDVAPVAHAYWKWNPNGMDFGLGAWECSECHCRNNNLPMNKKMNPLMFSGSEYCPNCGAKMDGTEERG